MLVIEFELANELVVVDLLELSFLVVSAKGVSEVLRRGGWEVVSLPAHDAPEIIVQLCFVFDLDISFGETFDEL